MATEHPKHAETEFPVHRLIATRWSPYVFDPQPIETAQLRACLEAARWSPSSYNEQPWSFLVASRTDPACFETMLGCLVEFNQNWARNAGALLVAVAATTAEATGKPHPSAYYEVGLAVAHLAFQATEFGLAVHQMGGFDRQRTRAAYDIPEAFDPITAIAIGRPGDPASAVDAAFAARDQATRERKPQGEFVFSGRWGKPW